MRAFQIIRPVVMLAFFASLSGCHTTPMNKQEATDWYARYGSIVRWVGYQGSDEQFHHFIARVMDDWNFIQIRRDELKLEDERPFSRASSAPLYYYLVDPSRDYQKIGEPGGAASRSRSVRPEAIQTSAAAGSGG